MVPVLRQVQQLRSRLSRRSARTRLAMTVRRSSAPSGPLAARVVTCSWPAAAAPTWACPRRRRRTPCATPSRPDLLARGGDLRSIQELLGDALLATTQIYTELDAERLIAAYRAAHPRARTSDRVIRHPGRCAAAGPEWRARGRQMLEAHEQLEETEHVEETRILPEDRAPDRWCWRCSLARKPAPRQ